MYACIQFHRSEWISKSAQLLGEHCLPIETSSGIQKWFIALLLQPCFVWSSDHTHQATSKFDWSNPQSGWTLYCDQPLFPALHVTLTSCFYSAVLVKSELYHCNTVTGKRYSLPLLSYTPFLIFLYPIIHWPMVSVTFIIQATNSLFLQ